MHAFENDHHMIPCVEVFCSQIFGVFVGLDLVTVSLIRLAELNWPIMSYVKGYDFDLWNLWKVSLCAETRQY